MPLAGLGEVELVADGFQFTEGPQWMEDDGVLLFTDVSRGRSSRSRTMTRSQTSAGRATGPMDSPSTPKGGCSPPRAMTRRVTRTESDGTVTPIAEQFEGIPLNQPNDIAVRSDGTIYFTDPYYGDGTTDLDFHGVFRIAPDGSLTAERRGAITEQPNGVALSPDETLLYVSNGRPTWSGSSTSLTTARCPRPETFVTTGDGPDGMAVDEAGNLFVTTAQRHRGLRSRRHALGRHPGAAVGAANCAFGGADGRTLYITAGEGSTG